MNSHGLAIAKKLHVIHQNPDLPADEEMDNLIGIESEEYENKLSLIDMIMEYGPEHRTYQADTTYSYIQRIFQILAPYRLTSFLDLGSGNGRILFYGALLFPNINFYGVELIPERVSFCKQLCQKIGLPINFVHANVFEEELPPTDCICLINSFFPSLMPKLVKQLKKHAKHNPFMLIAASTCTMILAEQDWLQEVELSATTINAYELRLFRTLI